MAFCDGWVGELGMLVRCWFVLVHPELLFTINIRLRLSGILWEVGIQTTFYFRPFPPNIIIIIVSLWCWNPHLLFEKSHSIIPCPAILCQFYGCLWFYTLSFVWWFSQVSRVTNCIDTDGSSWGVCNEESEREDPREKSKYEYKERCRREQMKIGWVSYWTQNHSKFPWIMQNLLS